MSNSFSAGDQRQMRFSLPDNAMRLLNRRSRRKRAVIGTTDRLRGWRPAETINPADSVRMGVTTFGSTTISQSTPQVRDGYVSNTSDVLKTDLDLPAEASGSPTAAMTTPAALGPITTILDESPGIQSTSTTPDPGGDTNAPDNGVPDLAPLESGSADDSAAYTEIVNLGGGPAGALWLGAQFALSGYSQVQPSGANAVNVTGFENIGFSSDLNGTELKPYEGDPAAGLLSGLKTIGGGDIYLFRSDNDNLLVGYSADNTPAIALYLQENSTGAKLWVVQYQAIDHQGAAADATAYINNLFVAVKTGFTFDLSGLASGQNTWNAVGSGNYQLIVMADEAWSKGQTVNTSQGGGDTTIGNTNQLIEGRNARKDSDGEGMSFTFARNSSNLLTADKRVFTSINPQELYGATTVTWSISQTQGGGAYAVATIKAYSTDNVNQGVAFAQDVDPNIAPNDDTLVKVNQVVITSAVGSVFTATRSGSGDQTVPAGTRPAGQADIPVTIAFKADGTVEITGLLAKDSITYTTAEAHNRVIIQNTGVNSIKGQATTLDFDIGGFGVNDAQVTATALPVGLQNDAPTVGSNLVAQLDDDNQPGGNNPSGIGDVPSDDIPANTSGTLQYSPSRDGLQSIEYLFSGYPAGAIPPGFSYVQDGTSLLIEQGGITVVTLTLVPTGTNAGDYTVSQSSPIKHPAGLAENNVVFQVRYLVTDLDGNTAEGTLEVNVDDDSPIQTVEANVADIPAALTVALDETVGSPDPTKGAEVATATSPATDDDVAGALGQQTTAVSGGLKALFTTPGSYGSDLAGSVSDALSLVLSSAAVTTNLVATNGGAVVLSVVGGEVIGKDNSGSGDIVLRIAITTVGGVPQLRTTLYEALRTSDNTKFDESTKLLTTNGTLSLNFAVTRTDGDNDQVVADDSILLASSTDSVFSFQDDGPAIKSDLPGDPTPSTISFQSAEGTDATITGDFISWDPGKDGYNSFALSNYIDNSAVIGGAYGYVIEGVSANSITIAITYDPDGLSGAAGAQVIARHLFNADAFATDQFTTYDYQGTLIPLPADIESGDKVNPGGPHPVEFRLFEDKFDLAILVTGSTRTYASLSDSDLQAGLLNLSANGYAAGDNNQNLNFNDAKPFGRIGSGDIAEIIRFTFTDYIDGYTSAPYSAFADAQKAAYGSGSTPLPTYVDPTFGTLLISGDSSSALAEKPVEGFGFDYTKLTGASADKAGEFIVRVTYDIAGANDVIVDYQFTGVSDLSQGGGLNYSKVFVGSDLINGGTGDAWFATSWNDLDLDAIVDSGEQANGQLFSTTVIDAVTGQPVAMPAGSSINGILVVEVENNELGSGFDAEAFNVANPRFYASAGFKEEVPDFAYSFALALTDNDADSQLMTISAVIDGSDPGTVVTSVGF